MNVYRDDDDDVRTSFCTYRSKKRRTYYIFANMNSTTKSGLAKPVLHLLLCEELLSIMYTIHIIVLYCIVFLYSLQT